MILEEPCPDCPSPPPDGLIHCCPVWGMGDPSRPSTCCATCRCQRVVLTDVGRAVLDLVRRNLEVKTFFGWRLCARKPGREAQVKVQM